MCNLSTGIEEKATEKFILNMYKKGYTLDLLNGTVDAGNAYGQNDEGE